MRDPNRYRARVAAVAALSTAAALIAGASGLVAGSPTRALARSELAAAGSPLLPTGPGAASARGTAPESGAGDRSRPPAGQLGEFVRRTGDHLVLGGHRYTFAGTNNYYPMYSSKATVDTLFGKAAASGFGVIRVWGSREIGTPGGGDSVDPAKDGFWLQYWDPALGRPTFNDGPDGLQRMDYLLAAARATGLRLVIPFVNNWNNFGGMDQYVRWAGASHHDAFYTDPTIRSWYRAWITHVLNRVNPLTGIAYKDDPTVLMWELGNEPRCVSAGAYPRSADCTTDTLVTWAAEMSDYVKSIDRKHLLGVGDEGFYAKTPTSSDWTHNGADGVDTIRLASLPAIDVMSFHLYPDGWKQTASWGTGWITEHVRDARAVHKPAFLGEFGMLDKATRNPVYKAWTDAFIAAGGTGELYWILSDATDGGAPYADYDGFTVYCPSPVCTTLGHAGAILRGKGRSFPPVADDDTVTVGFGAAATVRLTANDVAYAGARIAPDTVDLDPGTDGRQGGVTTAAGTVTVADDGTATVTAAPGYSGRSTFLYTVADDAHRTSAPATLTVVVKPRPTGALTLFSFEDGTQGWTEQGWNPLGGKVERTSAFATEGSHGLQVHSRNEWFGVDLAAPLDLTGKSVLRLDLSTGDVGTAAAVVLRTGAGRAWCQGPFVSYPAATRQVVEQDLLTGMSCEGGAAPDLSQVHGIYLYLNTGTFQLDDVRAE